MPCQRDGLVQRPPMRRAVNSGALALILSWPFRASRLLLAFPPESGSSGRRWPCKSSPVADCCAAGSCGCSIRKIKRVNWSGTRRTRIQHCGSVRSAAKLSSGGYSLRTLTIGRAAGSTTLTMERHTVSGANSVPLIASSHAFISAFRFSVKPGHCFAFHGSVRKAGANSILPPLGRTWPGSFTSPLPSRRWCRCCWSHRYSTPMRWPGHVHGIRPSPNP